MSQSIRISDELTERVKKNAKLFHRSPPRQIDHWAQIEPVMETALSYPVRASVSWHGPANLHYVAEVQPFGCQFPEKRRVW